MVPVLKSAEVAADPPAREDMNTDIDVEDEVSSVLVKVRIRPPLSELLAADEVDSKNEVVGVIFARCLEEALKDGVGSDDSTAELEVARCVVSGSGGDVIDVEELATVGRVDSGEQVPNIVRCGIREVIIVVPSTSEVIVSAVICIGGPSTIVQCGGPGIGRISVVVYLTLLVTWVVPHIVTDGVEQSMPLATTAEGVRAMVSAAKK